MEHDQEPAAVMPRAVSTEAKTLVTGNWLSLSSGQTASRIWHLVFSIHVRKTLMTGLSSLMSDQDYQEAGTFAL